LVVGLDPALTEVLNISTTPIIHHPSPPTLHSPNWAGYELPGNSGASNKVLEALMYYNQPTVSQPSGTGQPTCGFTACYASVWDGLENSQLAGNNNLVQAGTDGYLTCSTCISYEGWWQAGASSNTSYCPTTFTVHPNDQITIDIYNGVLEAPPAPSTTYYIYLFNSNGNQVCSPLNGYLYYSNMTLPTYATFILERLLHLAKFTSFNMNGQIYYNLNLQSAYIPYSNGWGHKIIMYSTCNGNSYYDVTPGSMSNSNGYGVWLMSWTTSQCT
jgi:hypothetical protein